MPTIVVDARIGAPIERCFDFARDVDAHVQTAAWTHERVVGGRMSGLLERGAFARFRHVHEFRVEHNVVVMTDTIIWQSPFGILGRLADAVFLEAHLRRFLRTKQAGLKRLIEDGLSHPNDDTHATDS